MFTASAPFGFFDYFRVPYEVVDTAGTGGIGGTAGYGELRVSDAPAAPRVYWPLTDTGPRAPGCRPGRFRMAGFSLAGPLVRGPAVGPSASPPPVGDWRPDTPVEDLHGKQVSAVWVDDRGNVLLPFDPAEVMAFLWSERYTTLGADRIGRSVRGAAVRTYYSVRPLLPRRVQLLMRRGYASRQHEPDFPAWPEEHSLHDLYDWLFALLATISAGPVPYLSPWPRGRSSAFVLTHDVETGTGRDNIEHLRGPERALGLRSVWNFVPERYDVSDALLDGLREEGCEIGVHGLRHDGQDLASPRKLRRRLPAMRRYAERWGAVGFRSPATQRSWDLMPTMGFDYDSSYTDSAPHEPQPGGCCTYLPFFNRDLVELPLTLPQDHTLFEILGHTDGEVWRSKAEAVRARGGMVLMIAHPDYVGCPGMLAAWDDLLHQFVDDPTVWHALPREVSTWWRERAATSVERRDGAWVPTGPGASRAEVRFATGSPHFTELPLAAQG